MKKIFWISLCAVFWGYSFSNAMFLSCEEIEKDFDFDTKITIENNYEEGCDVTIDSTNIKLAHLLASFNGKRISKFRNR